MKQTENITLEGTYSAKAFAALLADAKDGLLKNKVVLFWNTFCGDDFSSLTDAIDYHELPAELQKYFEPPA